MSLGEFFIIFGIVIVINCILMVLFGGFVVDYCIIYVSGEVREKYEIVIVYSCDGEVGGF